MASILNVDQIRNAAGTSSATIQSDGTFYPTGGVVQVVQSTITSTPTTTSTSFQDTGLSVTITPKSTSSKILVMADYGTGSGASSGGLIIQLVRGSTALFNRGASYSNQGATYGEGSFAHLDSPATTSAVTYKIQYKTQAAASTAAFNPAFSGYSAPTAHLTAMEIAG